MCGLAGVASTERRKKEMERKSAFRQLLEVASFRGKDATGVAVVKIADIEKPALVYKKAMKAADFIDLHHYRKMETHFDDYGFVIGHARSSTSDGWNMADANAHPFQSGAITLTHNGTIRNAKLLDSCIDHPVDSAHVAAALELYDTREVLEKLIGPFALVWHDARDGSLNFARNQDKPLFWCYAEGENTMYWGSELESIYAVLVRHEIKMDGKFRHCTAFQHFKFKLDNLREYTRLPFANRPFHAPGAIQQNPLGAPWTEEQRRLPVRPTETTSTTNTQLGKPSEDEEEGSGSVARIKGSVRPISRKKLRTVKERLLSLGRKIDQPICFFPEYWIPYKNQRPVRGMIQGHDRVKRQFFQIGNVTQDIWDAASDHRNIYGRIVNVKKSRTNPGDFILVADYAPDLMDRFIFKPRATSEVVRADKPFSFLGPGGRRITEKEFNELVKYGCGYCSRDLSTEDQETILWVGPSEQSPICETCSGSKEVRVTLGLSNQQTKDVEILH